MRRSQCSLDHRDHGWRAARSRQNDNLKTTFTIRMDEGRELGSQTAAVRRVNHRSTSAWHHGGSVGVGHFDGAPTDMRTALVPLPRAKAVRFLSSVPDI